MASGMMSGGSMEVEDGADRVTPFVDAMELQEKSPKSPPVRMMAPRKSFHFVLFLYFSTAFTESDVSLAFLRSLVTCELPTPNLNSDKVCPDGTYYGPDYNVTFNETCLPIPRGVPGWSASDHCAVKSIVVRQAQTIAGQLSSAGFFISMLSTTTFGMILIDSWGRKPIMLLAFFAQLFCSLCYMMSAGNMKPITDATTTTWLFTGCLIQALLSNFTAASSAMAIDGTEADSTERSGSVAAMTIVTGLSRMVSSFAGIAVLLTQPSDYTSIWTFYASALFVQLLLASWILVETKPELPSTRDQYGSIWKKAFHEIQAAYEVITSDRKLLAGLCCSSISAGMGSGLMTVMPGWTFQVLGMTQADSAGVSVAGALMFIIGSGISAPLQRRIGPLTVVYLSTVGISGGAIVIGSGYFFREQALILFWIGFAPLQAMFGGLAVPAVTTLLSSRVAPESQGRFFSGAGFLGGLSVSIGLFFFTNVLLSAHEEAESEKQMASVWFIYSAADIVVTCGWIYFWGCKSPTLKPGGKNQVFSTGQHGSRVMLKTQNTIATVMTQSTMQTEPSPREGMGFRPSVQ